MRRQFWYGVIGTVVVVAVGLTGYFVTVAKQAEDEKVLISELVQLRSAIAIYKSSFSENPENLQEALSAKYPFNVPKWTVKIDAEKGAVDPFLNPYKYSAESAWVQSSTPGFEKW